MPTFSKFDPGFILGLLGPLLTDPGTSFVKGHYHRPEADGVGGGRVTELLARPLLSQFFPELSDVAQPLGGEYAGRRDLLERLPFVVGYGVDVALLIDAFRTVGIGGLAQVDLGVRHHRNRTLDELGPQALAVSQAILDRAGLRPPGPATLRRPGKDPLPLAMHERPPARVAPACLSVRSRSTPPLLAGLRRTSPGARLPRRAAPSSLEGRRSFALPSRSRDSLRVVPGRSGPLASGERRASMLGRGVRTGRSASG
ncbi:hypothetical protein KSP35_12065 [Aquihabitans sp. G128]|uniref:hypothetical protein n=1 Tax=Aquihabitans sp. G128 TaxID=2849779 RepID=UPI001C21853E|nr:hypothetical protein [Aquihabitans sp. G128]QXC59149.1 hypothetical protein KSP35_12065 [Aquihabitans sp. G128]